MMRGKKKKKKKDSKIKSPQVCVCLRGEESRERVKVGYISLREDAKEIWERGKLTDPRQ